MNPSPARVALIGDYDPAVEAHQGIPRALALADDGRGECEWHWVHTSTLLDDSSEQLARFDGVWCVPASPYANTRGALAAIRFARQTARPFLGTCGGFQHALLEYAEAVWHVAQPRHAELDPEAAHPVIVPLACSLVGQFGDIRLERGSRLATIYGRDVATEAYHCRYGLSAAYYGRLTSGPLRVSGRDANGEVRAIELEGHPFFVATLFQPERAALAGRAHPLVNAFVRSLFDGRAW